MLDAENSPDDAPHTLASWWRSRLGQDSSYRSVILLEASIIGAVSALAALVLSRGAASLSALRMHMCESTPAIIVLPLFGLVGGAICGSMVKFIAPEITGSGIPQVKAFLKGFPMKLDLRVAFSKLVGGILVLGIGLPLGREGPTVQVGAATAGVLGGVSYQAPRHRRQLIAAGAGAGLAAAFNAPLAGVMFIVEELLKDVSSHTISTALVACFFAGIVSRYLGNHTLDVSAFREFPRASFFLHNMPVFLILGLMSGVVGSALNYTIIKSCQLNDKYFGERYVLRVALAGLVCGLVIALLPANFRDFAGIRQLIFEERSWRFAAAALAANFVLTSVAYGSGAPGGLFAPSLTIGAALGYLVGLLDLALFPNLAHSPTSLALAGMGAVFTAVARVPITATVIVFEMTSDFNLLLPLMICSIIAYIVGEKLTPGSIYDRLLELKGVFLNQKDENDPLANIFVKDFMHIGADTVEAEMKFSQMLQKLETSPHSGFPVIEDGKFTGVITESDVTSKRDLLNEESTVKDAMTPSAVCASKDDTIKNVITILDQHGLSRLPIVETDGTVIGMIARSDIISALARHDKNRDS